MEERKREEVSQADRGQSGLRRERIALFDGVMYGLRSKRGTYAVHMYMYIATLSEAGCGRTGIKEREGSEQWTRQLLVTKCLDDGGRDWIAAVLTS